MKVISYSLWSDIPMYTVGALRNAEMAKELYPGWECWFYTGESTPKEILTELETHSNVRVIRMEDPGDWTGMFWRFYPASDEEVELMISRDTDSRLTRREREAVKLWENSKDTFHIMRDHPYHTTPILGGMWGAKQGAVPKMKEMCEQYTKENAWQVDQNFLRDVVYPLVYATSMVHDPFFEGKPFPTLREGTEFVGQAFTEKDEILHPEHGDMIAQAKLRVKEPLL